MVLTQIVVNPDAREICVLHLQTVSRATELYVCSDREEPEGGCMSSCIKALTLSQHKATALDGNLENRSFALEVPILHLQNDR